MIKHSIIGPLINHYHHYSQHQQHLQHHSSTTTTPITTFLSRSCPCPCPRPATTTTTTNPITTGKMIESVAVTAVAAQTVPCQQQ